MKALADHQTTIETYDAQIAKLQEARRATVHALNIERRDKSAALMACAGIDPVKHNEASILGALMQSQEALAASEEDSEEARSIAADLTCRGASRLKDLAHEEASTKSLSSPVVDLAVGGGGIDLSSDVPTNVLILLFRDPVAADLAMLVKDEVPGKYPANLEALYEKMGLRAYTSVKPRCPVCSLVGTVAPREVCFLVAKYGGYIVHNPSPERFKGPKIRKGNRQHVKEMADARDAAAPISFADEMHAEQIVDKTVQPKPINPLSMGGARSPAGEKAPLPKNG